MNAARNDIISYPFIARILATEFAPVENWKALHKKNAIFKKYLKKKMQTLKKPPTDDVDTNVVFASINEDK